MRILHVNKFFDFHGGAEIYMHRLMRLQRAMGHDVHALSTKSPRNVSSEDESFFVTRYDLDRREGPVKDATKAANYLWNWKAQRAMREILDELKPDVVHIHNLYHHLSSSVLEPIRRKRIPCVQTLHDYKLACPNYKMFVKGSPCERCKTGDYWNAVRNRCLTTQWLPNVLAALEMGMTKSRQSYERTIGLFLCPSRFLKEKMEDWGEPSGKMRYVPNPTELPKTPAVRGGGYILYAGRLSLEKGLEGFLRAAAQVPELPVKLVGKGPEEAHLRALCDELGAKHVEFVGFLPPEELAEVRRRAEAVVLPSIWYENASLAALEAMADGLPLLATRIGGNPELVEDGESGFLVRPNDVDDWLRALRRFLAASPATLDKMAEASRDRVMKRHLWSTHVEVVMAAYQEAGGTV
jgi:glycosyltransferase involved in cell wall biosynthesis